WSSRWIESPWPFGDRMNQLLERRSAMRKAMPLRSKLSLAALVAFAVTGLNSAALAHIGGHAGGFTNGLAHPFYGLDHVLAMIAVGLWASQLGRPALWLLPLTFPV